MPTPPDATPPAPAPFLDVPTLLDQSRPRPQMNWPGFLLMAAAGLTLYSAFTSHGQARPGGDPARAATGLVILTCFVTAIAAMAVAYRRHRRQAQAVDAVEEMVQLRRWEPAGLLLDKTLADPVRSPRVWARALVQLSAVLSRHHRFADAVAVDDFLIGVDGLLDDGGAYAVRAMRAMALLRDDDLLGTDRALSDLRRRGPARESGPLALIEIYRDVKTGHPAEAIGLFGDRLPVLRQHLGHRVADAHALVARAYDMLGRADEAAAAWGRATALAPAAELVRRYPEVAPAAAKYPATPAPPEVA